MFDSSLAGHVPFRLDCASGGLPKARQGKAACNPEPSARRSAATGRNPSPMSESLVSGEVYCDEEWPHGLSCGHCPHVFREGEPYSERLYAFDELPLVVILCVGCATTPERSLPPEPLA